MTYGYGLFGGRIRACAGITKEGRRCLREGWSDYSESFRCWQHRSTETRVSKERESLAAEFGIELY